ncbi:MAG: DNA helicase RecQ [Gammaproteobacteria bacterium]|nr:DNA helicase RecQ [Gammaproteobacteria bacterium]
MSQALDILSNRFGYQSFRFQQQEIIETLISGQDALVLMPTGGGKSVCYQIPAIARKGVGIVISPLIALMQDQVDALEQNGVKATFLNSTQTNAQQQQVRQQLIDSTIDLLYVAPERAMTEDFLQLLGQCEIALFAIDEAHCVSQWGHDFRRDYQNLYRLHDLFPEVPRIALTATADQRTRFEIEQQLNLQQARKFVHSFDRPNIFYQISEGQNNRQRLWNFISRKHAQDSGIVYCLSRKQVESTADWLVSKGRTALPYHAGLDKQIRADNQRQFLQQENVIIVATIAFGMGIDKPDVRFVAHLNLPKNIESYYQETGRAGRDGQPANAWLAYGLQDIITLRQMSQDSDASESHKRNLHHKLEAMLGLCEQTRCRRQTILNYFDEAMDKPCGHCDNCVSPPQTWDATEASRMALSCVYRTGQRFGVNYLIDVLLGKVHSRISQNGHDRVSTFGIGTSLSSAEWHSIYRQLIALGYIRSDAESHGAIQLTSHCKALLKGDETLLLRKVAEKAEAEKTAHGKTSKSRVRIADQPLFDALREQRRLLAEKQGVPPFVILHDKTLQELSLHRPTSAAQLQTISGIGARKLELYGSEILDIIARFPLDQTLDNNLTNTVNETLQLFLQNNRPEQIAELRELSINTIYNHLSAAIELDLVKLEDVIPLNKSETEQLIYAIELAQGEEVFRMKNVYESLQEKYDYSILNCVKASMGVD